MEPIELPIPEGTRTVLTGTGIEVYNANGGTVRVGGKAVQPSEDGIGWFFRLARHTPPTGTPDGCAAVRLFDDSDWDLVAAWCGGYVGDDSDVLTEQIPCIGVPRPDGSVSLARVRDWITLAADGQTAVWREDAQPVTPHRPMVADEVLIRGTVIEVVPGAGVTIELFNKASQHTAWVRESDVVQVVTREGPPEPDDGTWLVGEPDDDGRSSVFRRSDAEGHCDDDRRYDRRWWDVAAAQWIDWPTAVRRGANPATRLVPAP